MTVEMHSFFNIDVYDEATGCIVHELYLEKSDQNKFPDFIRQIIDRLGANQSEPLSWDSLAGHPILSDEFSNQMNLPIRVRHEACELPYKVHGGREFDLMMKGLKPLSVFCHRDMSASLSTFLQKYFDPLVGSGRLISDWISSEETGDSFMAPAVMYALPGEAWRFEAYRLLASAARIAHWNDALEFIEGSLLGYSRDQSRLWLDHRRARGLRWGLHQMYRLMTRTEVGLLRKNGFKSFSIDNERPIRLYLPYHHADEIDPGVVLAKANQASLARFYVPLLEFEPFSQGVTRISDIDFGVYVLPGPDLARLNSSIDGAIDIIEFQPEDGSCALRKIEELGYD
jgi:hypothetical protein